MSSEESDLTEYSDEEYTPAPGQSKKKAGAGQKTGYKIRNVLKAPRATTYSAQALYHQIHSNDINLEPEYQRDIVWPETKQIGLIDSIFRNFYIPPVIFVVKVEEDGSESRTCIDGKQRLTSLYRFMDGEIPHRDPFTNEKLWYKDMGKGSSQKILPEKYKRLFANKQIVCVEYQDITSSDEREIFQRVQLGMALTPAEKLQATMSPRATFVRDLLATYLNEGGLLGGSMRWDSTRGGDFRCIAQLVWNIEQYPDSDKQGTIVQLDRWLHAQEEPSEELSDHVHSTLSIFSELVKDKKYQKVFRYPVAKIAPIEFIMIAVLIYAHKDELSLGGLADAISTMRKQVRKVHDDVRLNDRVGKTLLSLIKDLDTSKIKDDGEQPAGLKSTKKLKRKRVEDKKGAEKKVKKEVREPLVVPPRPKSRAATTSSQPPTPSTGPPISQPSPVPAAATMGPPTSYSPNPNIYLASPSPAIISARNAAAPSTGPPVDRLAAIKAARANAGAFIPTQSPLMQQSGYQQSLPPPYISPIPPQVQAPAPGMDSTDAILAKLQAGNPLASTINASAAQRAPVPSPSQVQSPVPMDWEPTRGNPTSQQATDPRSRPPPPSNGRDRDHRSHDYRSRPSGYDDRGSGSRRDSWSSGRDDRRSSRDHRR